MDNFKAEPYFVVRVDDSVYNVVEACETEAEAAFSMVCTDYPIKGKHVTMSLSELKEIQYDQTDNKVVW